MEFVREIEAMHADGARVFVEVGPRSVLSGLVDGILGDREHLAVPLDRAGRPGLTGLVHALAALAAEGVPVRTPRLFEGRPAPRVDLSDLAPDVAPPPGPLEGRRRQRPARRPAGHPRRPPTPRPAGAAHDDHDHHERRRAAGCDRRTAPAPDPERLPAVRPAEIVPIAGDGVAQVMGRYQDVMQHFIELQRSVMLAYLGDRRAGTAPPVATARRLEPPAPAPSAPSVPPVAATPAVAAPSSNGGGNGHATLTRVEIREHLLAVVSERTGYPPDMLALDADLEADLGIDSIKRVEIAGTLSADAAARRDGRRRAAHRQPHARRGHQHAGVGVRG